MPRSKAKRKSIKGDLRSPGKQTKSNPNVTIDLTESLTMEKFPEVIDLDDIEDDENDEDEIEIVAVQVGSGASKNLRPKVDLSVVVVEDKPIENTSFSSSSPPCPFTFGNVRKEVDNLMKAQSQQDKICQNVSLQTPKKQNEGSTSNTAKLNEAKQKTKISKSPRMPPTTFRFLAGQKIDNNFVENKFSGIQNNIVGFGRKKNGFIKKNFKGNKKNMNANAQAKNFNSEKQSLQFISNVHRPGFKKNKKPKRIHREPVLQNHGKNIQHNSNLFQKSNRFVFTHSNGQNKNKVSASLTIREPETSRQNQISSNGCSDSEQSECEIVATTIKAPNPNMIGLPTYTYFGLNAYVSPTSGEKKDSAPGQHRPIVIDGSNVAIGHGKNRYFSSIGIKICIEFFLARGHKKVKAFVPKYRHKSSEAKDPFILEELEKDELLVFTPSREVGGHRIASYDDRYIVQYAATVGAIIVSNDNYRDLYDAEESWRETIKKRILPFTWIDDGMIIFPQDPLGRYGPSLDQFLLF